MSPKLKDPYVEKNNRLVPGPGNYTISNAMMRTAPQFGFGSSTRKERKTSPKVDPGAYNPSYTFTQLKAPQYKVGTETRKMFDEKNSKAIPGPGNYQTIVPRDTPLYSMGSKLEDLEFKKRNFQPGAGTYNPTKESTVKKFPAYSMGAKLKGELGKANNVPGPGTYVNSAEKLRNKSPSFGFGTMKRPDIAGKASEVPGPGSYVIKSRVGEATQSLSRN